MLESLDSLQFDELNDYHFGNLSTGEKLLFEAKILSDPILAQAYEEFKQTLQIVKAQHTDNLKNSFNLLDSKLDNELLDNPNVFSKYKYPILTIVILCLATLIFYLPFWNKVSPAIAFNERDLGLPVVMGAATHQTLDEAMTLYKQNQYEQSEIILKSLQKAQNNDTLNYYIGINEYQLSHFEPAIESLKKVDSHSVFYQKSLYRQGLAYWQLDKLDPAKHIFRSLDSPNSPYSDQAKAILKKIK